MYYKSTTEYLKEEIKKGRVSFDNEISKADAYYIEATLIPNRINTCENCGSHHIIKNGKKVRVINDDYISNRQTKIYLTYNRLLCKDCHKMFNDSLPLLQPNTSISLNLKLNILEDLSKDVSFTYIANKYHVSIQTVANIFETYINFDRYKLSDVLCMDEFKNLKSSLGKYAFVLYSPSDHKIIDVLEDRQQNRINQYLYSIDWKEKNGVKYVITDMSESYRTIIRKHFINATHIVDSFHYTRYVTEAFNSVRRRIQSSYNTKSKEYRILKTHWRILSSYYNDLDQHKYYNQIKSKYTSVDEIIQDSLYLSSDLSEAYTLTQNFLYAIKSVKYEDADEFIEEFIKLLKETNLKEFNDLTGMFRNWKTEIVNSFLRFGDRRLHNGYLEGINNHIKVIKRISYGYKNFRHFRNRLMLIINNDYQYKHKN